MSIITKGELETFIIENWNEVNSYIDRLAQGLVMPIYSSVDIRESRHKFSPVDHNIYPAGFNHICEEDLRTCSSAFARAILKVDKSIRRVGIIPESHTRNALYLDHLVFLGQCLKDAGYEVVFISLDEDLFTSEASSIELQSHSKFTVEIFRGRLREGEIEGAFAPVDLLLLNNDQSSRPYVDWQRLQTVVLPTPAMGWFQRHKIVHLEHYQKVAQTFCHHFSIKPSLIGALFSSEQGVDFATKEGLERIGSKVDALLAQLEDGARVFVKGDQGTYGMGIMVVKSGREIVEMNRKKRNKMDRGKNSIKFTSVVIQECVETILEYDGMPAEVAIYLIDGIARGGFVRANSKKDTHSNLNSEGIVFKKYCITEIRQNRNQQSKESIYSVIARLATLAAAHEMRDVEDCLI